MIERPSHWEPGSRVQAQARGLRGGVAFCNECLSVCVNARTRAQMQRNKDYITIIKKIMRTIKELLKDEEKQFKFHENPNERQ